MYVKILTNVSACDAYKYMTQETNVMYNFF